MANNKFLIACLLVYAVLTGLLIATVPMGHAPDEMAHMEYAQHLAEKKSLPVFEPTGANAPGYEFHQPPLYYALVAPFYMVSESAAPYAARSISLVCGALTIAFLWQALGWFFPNDNTLRFIATGLAGIWPMHIAVGASGGNDALSGMFCAAMLWAVARMVPRVETGAINWRDGALLGLFFGLGLLTKSTALVVGIVALGGALHLVRRSERVSYVPLAAAIGVTALLGGWWLVRNTMLYGDPLAAKIFEEAFTKSSPGPQALMQGLGLSLIEYLRAFFVILFASCWGFFGGPNTALSMLNPFGVTGPKAEAMTVLPVMLIPFLATFVALWGYSKWKWQEWKQPILPILPKIGLIWWGLAFWAVALVLLRFNLTYFQAQARYMHPALLPMCVIFALGWREILDEGRALRVFAIGFGGVLVLLTLWNAFGWRTLV
jgi:hypothetical protein